MCSTIGVGWDLDGTVSLIPVLTALGTFGIRFTQALVGELENL